MDIKLDDANLQKLLGLAIVQAMDTQGREAILTSALAHLTTKVKEHNGFDAKLVSPIDRAFNNAIAREAEVYAREVVQTSDFKELMQERVKEAVAIVFGEDKRAELVDNLARGIREAMYTRNG